MAHDDRTDPQDAEAVETSEYSAWSLPSKERERAAGRAAKSERSGAQEIDLEWEEPEEMKDFCVAAGPEALTVSVSARCR